MTTERERDVQAALAEVMDQPAWALIRLHEADEVTLIGGRRTDLALLADIPVENGVPEPDGEHPEVWDRLVLVPFRQIGERGFKAHDDGTPLSSIAIDVTHRVGLAEVIRQLPQEPLQAKGSSGFNVGDEEYARLVEAVVRDEIGNGEGANLVIARDYVAELADWDAGAALSVFRRLLVHERGAYWTFVVFTGDRYLIGASPERHVRVRRSEVSMNPISGTFRLDSVRALEDLEAALLRFLADPKETYELFMVVDEELKMMCALCPEGGSVLGPYLKPMSHLIHTEYLLAGRSPLDVREILRGSMFAATVTGSPVENACRLIEQYETGGRGYYGSVLALIGRDGSGEPVLDAPIVLRTAQVSVEGRLRVTAGATLVRDSDPSSEVAETHAKAAGVLSAFGLVPGASTQPADVASLVQSARVARALVARNDRLSRFWLTDQAGVVPSPDLQGRTVIVLDGEDDFVSMLRHMLHVLGAHTRVVGYRDYADGDFDEADFVIVGPGPGDPRDLAEPKIATVRRAVNSLLASHKPFLAVCLGHQVLCGALGLELVFKDIVFQGTQTEVDIFGRREKVGFYNTFVARLLGDRPLPDEVVVDLDAETGDVNAIRGPHYAGVQCHLESILTEHGFTLLRAAVTAALTGPAPLPAG
jgi:phenazine biosynthesis protein phzE